MSNKIPPAGTPSKTTGMPITRGLREAKDMRTLLSEIHLANHISRFRDINKARRRQAVIPDVGIFWLDLAARKVYAVKTTLPEADDLAGVKVNPTGHYENWSLVVRQNPKWTHCQYEDIPRGRVVYRNTPRQPRFVVYANPAADTARLRAAIATKFNLPHDYYEFDFTDEHYQIIAHVQKSQIQ